MADKSPSCLEKKLETMALSHQNRALVTDLFLAPSGFGGSILGQTKPKNVWIVGCNK